MSNFWVIAGGKRVSTPAARAAAVRGKALRGSEAHDLTVALNRLDDKTLSPGRKRAIVNFVVKTTERAPLDRVVDIWDESIRAHKHDFALAVARAAPKMISRADAPEVERIYDLLGETISLVPSTSKEAAADALLNAVLLYPGEVPTVAKRKIRQHRSTLKRYPDVWRYIGSFAG